MGKVLVAGSANMDVVVTAPRRPAVGETVLGSDVRFLPGGKGANQAVAAAKLGAETSFIGRVGQDVFGHEIVEFLAGNGVDTSRVKQVANERTGVAMISVVAQTNSIIVVPGANAHLTAADMTAIEVGQRDVLVAQFEIPVPAVEAFLRLGREKNATTLLNIAPVVDFAPSLLDLPDMLIMNETEFAALTRSPASNASPSSILEACTSLRRRAGQAICVTLGEHGAVALAGDEAIVISGRAVPAVDTTGAGDCFVGAFAARICAGADIRSAVEYANAAASICVQRMGAGPSMPSIKEMQALGLHAGEI